MPAYKDPTRIRVSEQFLLSDFLLCDSVARFGYANRFDTDDNHKMAEVFRLAETLEILIDRLGPLRISYGFISPELSQRIVKYQDPNKPSYHRFDIGAAADIRFGELLQSIAPVQIAWEIQRLADQGDFEYSRMITYSESDWICFATSMAGESNRQAFYENRFIEEERKPKFVTYPQVNRESFIQRQPIPENWRGRGYPSYHGGGRLQFHHQIVSKHFSYLDFLYSKRRVHTGVGNLPPQVGSKDRMNRWLDMARQAGIVLDFLTDHYRCHFSIISAYESTDQDSARSGKDWMNRYCLTIVPPESLDGDDVRHTLVTECHGLVNRVWGEHKNIIEIEGHLI
jgi:hypothetical protein